VTAVAVVFWVSLAALAWTHAVYPLVATALARVRRADPAVSATLGAVAAALLIGLSQSYFHAAGNIAFVAFWVVLLLASVSGLSTRTA